LLSTGVLAGLIGKVGLILMILLPMLGFFLGFKSQRGFLKWGLIFLNFIAFCSITYILLLGFGMGEA
jgi:hypothetical protein